MQINKQIFKGIAQYAYFYILVSCSEKTSMTIFFCLFLHCAFDVTKHLIITWQQFREQIKLQIFIGFEEKSVLQLGTGSRSCFSQYQSVYTHPFADIALLAITLNIICSMCGGHLISIYKWGAILCLLLGLVHDKFCFMHYER